MRSAVVAILHPLAMKLFDLAQGCISFALLRASSISRSGICWVFFTKTLTTTTRRPSAVTYNARDAVLASHSHFPQWPAHMLDVWLPNPLQTKLLDQATYMHKADTHVCRQGSQFLINHLVQSFYGPRHCGTSVL